MIIAPASLGIEESREPPAELELNAFRTKSASVSDSLSLSSLLLLLVCAVCANKCKKFLIDFWIFAPPPPPPPTVALFFMAPRVHPQLKS